MRLCSLKQFIAILKRPAHGVTPAETIDILSQSIGRVMFDDDGVYYLPVDVTKQKIRRVLNGLVDLSRAMNIRRGDEYINHTDPKA